MRRADLHPGGNVNNVVHMDYLQETRLDFLLGLAPSLLPSPGSGLAMLRTTIDYMKPLRLNHAPLLVRTWVTEVRGAASSLG
jgi:acyl-CoA thioesterase FadM